MNFLRYRRFKKPNVERDYTETWAGPDPRKRPKLWPWSQLHDQRVRINRLESQLSACTFAAKGQFHQFAKSDTIFTDPWVWSSALAEVMHLCHQLDKYTHPPDEPCRPTGPTTISHEQFRALEEFIKLYATRAATGTREAFMAFPIEKHPIYQAAHNQLTLGGTSNGSRSTAQGSQARSSFSPGGHKNTSKDPGEKGPGPAAS